MKTQRSVVSIVKGSIRETSVQYSQKDVRTVRDMIVKSLDLIGGLQQLVGEAGTVVVKPNLVEIPFETAGGSVVTDPRVLEALVGILKDHGVKRVRVAEGRGPTWGLCHINPDGGGALKESILVRFDCDLSRDVDWTYFKRNNLRHEASIYFQP